MANRRRRPPRSRRILRLVVLGAVIVVAVLYYHPARAYFHARDSVAARAAEVAKLRRQHAHLERLVAASTSDAELAREARRLGLVKPGERLFIVKGIKRWLRQHANVGGGE